MSASRRVLLAAPLAMLADRALAQSQKTIVIPLKWYAVQIEDNAFTVEMPGIPDRRLVGDKSAKGTAFSLHSYSLEVGGYSYVAQTALYPADVDGSKPRAILQAALDGRAPQLEGRKWGRVEFRELQGATVAESVGTVRGGNGLRQLVLMKGQRFASLAFLGAAGGMIGVEAERFFKSLKLLA